MNAAPLTRRAVTALARARGWNLKGSRAEGYLLVTRPGHGDCSIGYMDTLEDVVVELDASEQRAANVARIVAR